VKLARWLLPGFTFLLAGVVTLWEFDQRTSPGPLHPAHAARTELGGNAGCRRCHGSGEQGIDAAACGKCHAAVLARVGSGRGLHGSAEASACADCHGEHHGAETRLLDARSFARAGVVDVAAYDHSDLPGFALTGQHRGLACRRCHPAADDLDPPAARYLGLTAACAGCHADPHHGAYGSGCAECHGQEHAFRDVPGFGHAVLPLRGGHAAVRCAGCHAENTERAVAALRQDPRPARTCDQCHRNPHLPEKVTLAPAALLLTQSGDCARCHRATAWDEARPTAAEHARLGFPLRRAHAGVECGACHGGPGSAPAYAGAAPSVDACGSCHGHPHRPELVRQATVTSGVGGGCAGCHSDAHLRFAEGTIGLAQHAFAGFALTAPHAGIACAKCHAGATTAERFPGRAPADCRACHRDVHRGQFDHEPRYGQCTACHEAARFSPHTFDVEAHARTAFALTGAHAAVGCTRCHAEVADGARMFHGTARACAACHDDPHVGQFAAGGRTDCARCHTTTSFTSSTFDHGRDSRFVLDATHRALACGQCHATMEVGGRRVRKYKPLGTLCGDCHVLDPARRRR